MTFFDEILKKSKCKSAALKEYLKKIVIYQSANKANSNWNEKRRATIDMTYRQIKQNTGLSLGTISKVINEMLSSGELAVSMTKASKYKNPMRFYYFVTVLESITKKKAFNVVKSIMDLSKKMNTRNIYYINKLIFKKVFKDLSMRQLDLFNIQWDFLSKSWKTIEQPNFKYSDSERNLLFSQMKSLLN